MDRRYVMTGFGFGILGMVLGIYMGASHNHSQMPTHAHIMLVGLVLSFIYGTCFRLWLNVRGKLPEIQYWLHLFGTILMSTGLFLLYGGHAPMTTIEPLLIVSSLALLIALVCMKVMFIRSR